MISWMLDREIGESCATATNAETETNIFATVVISDLSEETDGLLALRLPECSKMRNWSLKRGRKQEHWGL